MSAAIGCRAALASAIVALLTSPAWPQVDWRLLQLISTSNHAMAWDAARARIVLFGGRGGQTVADTTWEWDGNTWTRRLPTSQPPARMDHALAYDAARQRTVLFGGRTWENVALADTWEWDGAAWTRRTPATAPPARSWPAMTYDVARGKVVLFGGSLFLFDTWEWDGTNWQQRNPATVPPESAAEMVYDSARQVVVLHGSDTWEWDGVDWTKRSLATRPPSRGSFALAYDAVRRRVVLFGGVGFRANTADTWEWDGTNWVERFPSTVPAARSGHALAFDAARGRVVMAGPDTWEWDGSDWTQRAPATSPGVILRPSAVADSGRGRIVMFGGARGRSEFGPAAIDETWEWDGAVWIQRTPNVRPRGRERHAMAYDAHRGRTVVFGGLDPGQLLLDDTWEWDGSAWSRHGGVVRPAARSDTAMAYDARRRLAVLFGGRSIGGDLGDTWVWDGSTWSLLAPASSPPARRAHGMAFDERRGVVVLFGGVSGSSSPIVHNDTWEWDGSAWRQRAPARVPPAGSGSTLVWDAARQRTVLFGGSSAAGALGQTWEWDGAEWIVRTPAQSPLPRFGHALAYHHPRGQIVLFGGRVKLGSIYDFDNGDTWRYLPLAPARFSTFDAGCADSAGVPALSAHAGELPWVGDTFTLRVDALPAGPAPVALALVLGASNTSWGALRLPLDLAFLGMPGCRWLVRPDLALPAIATGATALLPIAIPGDVQLVGSTWYAQCFVEDRPANALGVTNSEGGAMQLGAK